ncbi:hypothetical protein F4810DRAFT_674867 [Camillea tinctor]|nr:hypothetical protein F4810DRAFT_674867 [Camillea tinctor]
MPSIISAISNIPRSACIATLCALGSLVYFGSRHALPKPRPAMLYNYDAVSRLMADVPSLMEVERKGGRLRLWFAEQPRKQSSSIFQVVLGPRDRPSIVIIDFERR